MQVFERLTAFSDAVRSKPNWFHKVLDPDRDLSTKWAIEANLFDEDPNKDIEGIDRRLVLGQIEELKEEARRIRFEDLLIHSGSVHAIERDVEFDTIEADVRKELNFIQNSKHGIRPVKLRESVGVFASNGLVPTTLHKELRTELENLAAAEPKDFHPGTHGKVQDLIHPSLYPFVGGVTKVDGETPHATGFETAMSDQNNRVILRSRCSWIPSTIIVSEHGRDARIDSYINGLGSRDQYPVLYRLIELTFLMALAHLQKTVQSTYEWDEPPSVRRWNEREHLRNRRPSESEWNTFIAKQKKEKGKARRALARREEQIEKEADAERGNQSLFNESTKQNHSDSDGEDSDVSSAQDSDSADGDDSDASEESAKYTDSDEESDDMSDDDPEEKSYKVIIKAADYILRPGEKYEGTWHLEGMPHERIVASAIYYWHADASITDHGLSLKRSRISVDFPDPEEHRHEDFHVSIAADKNFPKGMELTDYPSDWEDLAGPGASTTGFGGPIAVGTISTHEEAKYNGTGRIISFPNWLQHRVSGVENVSITGGPPASRKILCFFLVDDDEVSYSDGWFPTFTISGVEGEVFTTSEIASQKRATNIPTLHFLLPIACQRLTGKNLPRELAEIIVGFGDLGFSRAEAEQYRREVMADRTGDKLNSVGGFSLCEH
ncbi:hypothetical protein C8J56DRAFT_1031469 [Mycena floridula]|nr:hypothetical protein C8J56DRAFT_1031469 [Mycena floridula]